MANKDLKMNVSQKQMEELVQKAKDWITTHGVVIKSEAYFEKDQVQITAFTLLPSPFPKKEFEKAQEVQVIFNELIHKVAYDYAFLQSALQSTIEVDEFTNRLFNIYNRVLKEGLVQDISLGLLRSDYMLDEKQNQCIKQVEINTISSSFGGFADIISDYHRFILKELKQEDRLSQIPENQSSRGIGAGLAEAWKLYNNEEAVILFVIEIKTYNVYDQRFLEYQAQNCCPKITIIRSSLTDLIEQIKLGQDKKLFVNDIEVAVVYYRAGYSPHHYLSENEWNVRYLIESSMAIKCPSIHYHLAGTKKVQQKLTEPGILEKFISDPDKLNKIKDVFVNIYSLDINRESEKIIESVMKNSKDYVLKPQREGGGNNFYHPEIIEELKKIQKTKDQSAFIIMDKINPPKQQNYIIRPALDSINFQNVISELGIYGVIIGNSKNIMKNEQVGHVLRTKPSTTNEGGIIVGAGSLDGPLIL